MMCFIERYRTRISQLLALVYLALFAFSEKKFETAFPEVHAVTLFLGCVLVGIGVVGRLWCALYIAGYKTNKLITEGPYSMCRNPLYFFSLLGAAGVGLCTESLTLAVVIIFAFAAIYPVVIQGEENRLLGIYGAEYRAYMKFVPRFFPNLKLLREPEHYTVNAKIFRREVCDAFLFVATVGLFRMLEQLLEIGLIKTYFTLY